jgi:Ni2+-binding GTPase involved in maturation of urease and hydrogenase
MKDNIIVIGSSIGRDIMIKSLKKMEANEVVIINDIKDTEQVERGLTFKDKDVFKIEASPRTELPFIDIDALYNGHERKYLKQQEKIRNKHFKHRK